MQHTEAASAWLRGAMEAWWWRLPGDQVRVALALVARAERGDDGRRLIEVTSDGLAESCGVSRGVVRRALAALDRGGFCRVAAARGHRGRTVIEVLGFEPGMVTDAGQQNSARPFDSAPRVHLDSSAITEASLQSGAALDHSSEQHPAIPRGSDPLRPFLHADRGQLEARDITGEMSDAEGYRGQLKPPDPTIPLLDGLPHEGRGHLQVTGISSDSGEILASSDLCSRPEPRASDLDLLRSPKKDLRSESESGRSSDPEILTDLLSPTLSSEPAKKRRKKTPEEAEAAKAAREAKQAEKIPDRAWAAADYLRSQILSAHPTAALAAVPWEPKGGGPAFRHGRRLTWALEFAKLHRERATAEQVLPMDTLGSGAIWDDIARTVAWLFNRDPSKPMQLPGAPFVVLSPDSLAEKWDRIQAVRRNQGAPRPSPRSPDNNQPPRAFRRWDEGWK